MSNWTPLEASTELKAGIAALECGDFKLACRQLTQCQEINTEPEASYRLGVAQCLLDETENAIATWKQTLRLDATFAPALYDLALAYTKTGNDTQAAAIFSRLLTFHPDHQQGRFNFGNLLYRMGRTEDAISMYAPLTDAPEPPHGILVNLGRALRRSGRLKEADACYQRALIGKPDDAFTLWNRSHVLFLLEKWDEGFAAWEARLKTSVQLPFTPDFPEWTDGNPPKRLLIIAEQGHGDTIQCLRYIPALCELGCKPVLALHSAIIPLAQTLLPSIECINFKSGPNAKADKWVPIFSLPHRLGLTNPTDTYSPNENSTFARGIAKLKPSAPTHPSKASFKIGLVWAGNPGHDNDHIRSMSIEALFPLISGRSDIQWQSLQLGDKEDLASLPTEDNIIPMPQVHNFADTAKIIAAQDLVICVDTAVAHLSCSLGINTWLMLAAEPDWRWGQTEKTTAWYPSARLFRQKQLGNWSTVIQDISDELNSLEPQRL